MKNANKGREAPCAPIPKDDALGMMRYGERRGGFS
jgi:hypothetical protein